MLYIFHCHFQMESSVHLLRGKVYEAMDNRNLASECFRESLRQDVYCYEAFELLVNHHMLNSVILMSGQ